MVLWSCLQLHNISCSAHWWPLEAILTLWNPWETAVPNLPCVVLMIWHWKENLTHWCLPHIRALHLSLPHSVLCVWICEVCISGVQWVQIMITWVWSIFYSTFSGIYIASRREQWQPSVSLKAGKQMMPPWLWIFSTATSKWKIFGVTCTYIDAHLECWLFCCKMSLHPMWAVGPQCGQS